MTDILAYLILGACATVILLPFVLIGRWIVKAIRRPRKPRPKEPPKQATREDHLRRVQKEYLQNLAVLDSVPMDEADRRSGKERMLQKFIDDLEKLL